MKKEREAEKAAEAAAPKVVTDSATPAPSDGSSEQQLSEKDLKRME